MAVAEKRNIAHCSIKSALIYRMIVDNTLQVFYGHGPYRFIIEAVVGHSYKSDIAVDDISVNAGLCPPPPNNTNACALHCKSPAGKCVDANRVCDFTCDCGDCEVICTLLYFVGVAERGGAHRGREGWRSQWQRACRVGRQGVRAAERGKVAESTPPVVRVEWVAPVLLQGRGH